MRRRFLLVALTACAGGPAERKSPTPAAVVRPAESAAIVVAPVADASAPVVIADAGAEPTLTVRGSDVVVTGGLGYGNDRYSRPSDPKPGDKIEVVRIFCNARGKPEEEKQYTCAGASKSSSPDGNGFDKRVRECFDVKERAGTPAEAAKVAAALRASKDIDVPRGQLYTFEVRYAYKQPERKGVPCGNTQGHPCDPVTVETGRMVEISETIAQAVGPGRLDVSNPYWAWNLDWIDITPMPASMEGQSHVVRVAMLFNRAIDAVRSKDRARIAEAVKALDDDVHGFEDRTLQPIAMKVSGNLEALRAIVAGRATIGDACKRWKSTSAP